MTSVDTSPEHEFAAEFLQLYRQEYVEAYVNRMYALSVSHEPTMLIHHHCTNKRVGKCLGAATAALALQ